MEDNTKVAAPINYTELMQKAAQEQMKTEKPDNTFISFKSGVLSFNEQAAPGNKIRVVVVGSAFENSWFPGKFDPKVVRSPDCYALGHDEESMGPIFDEVTDPQHESCSECELNEWESDPNGGKGKACKNSRRLAVVLESNIGDPNADVMYARLPVTSVANWSKYVNQVGNVVKRPTWGVVTEMSVVPDAKSQFKVCFQFMGLLPDEVLESAKALYDNQYHAILFGYPKNDGPYVEPAPKGKGK